MPDARETILRPSPGSEKPCLSAQGLFHAERRIGSLSVLKRAAGEHLLAHVGIFDVLPCLQPTRLDHRTVSFVIDAFASFVVGKIFHERCAEWLERLARGLEFL